MPVPVETDVELRRAVAQSYHLSRKFHLSLYDAWFVGRTIALEIRPGMDEFEAGRRVMMIIAWTVLQQDGRERAEGWTFRDLAGRRSGQAALRRGPEVAATATRSFS